MKTLVTDSVEEAAAIVKFGGLVAFPTETVYGLGADVFNESAVGRIFEAKQRPADNPLIAHIGTLDQIGVLASEITESARKLIHAFFPGALTVVLRKTPQVPIVATAGLDTIGIRMPRLGVSKRFLIECGTPVVAPSANISGRPSPTTWEAVLEDLDGRIDCILSGEATEIGLESTVVDCTGEYPILLRRGSISLDELRIVVPELIEASETADEKRRSPGTRHKHYSPRAHITIIDGNSQISNHLSDGGRFGFIGLCPQTESFHHLHLCLSVEEYAQTLFEFFRECDRRGIDEIFCEAVSEEGIGAAVMDRLRRAADSNE